MAPAMQQPKGLSVHHFCDIRNVHYENYTVTHSESHWDVSAVSLFESREQYYIKAMNNIFKFSYSVHHKLLFIRYPSDATNVLDRSWRGRMEARSMRAACAPNVSSSSSTSRCISLPTRTSSSAMTAGAALHGMSLSRNTSARTGWSWWRRLSQVAVLFVLYLVDGLYNLYE